MRREACTGGLCVGASASSLGGGLHILLGWGIVHEGGLFFKEMEDLSDGGM